MTRPRPNRGSLGEDLAEEYLRRIGFHVEARNLRTAHGEIDLLVRAGRLWAAVEVKTRSSHDAPERCVGPGRIARLARSLRALAPTLRPAPRALRIDLVAVRILGTAPPEIRHFAAVRTLPPPAGHGAGPEALRPRLPKVPRGLRSPGSEPSSMPTLAEQIIPRRKLLLLVSECAIFTGVLFLGTSLPPLADRAVDLFGGEGHLRGLLSCFSIALICQASLSYNDLYDWKVSQNRAELPNRLLHSLGYALVMLACVVMLAPSLFSFPGLPETGSRTWKLILLLGAAFASIYIFRAAFHWFFYKWRFGERVIVLGSGTAAEEIARMIVENPLSGFELVGMVSEGGRRDAVPGDPPWRRDLGSIDELRTLCDREGVARIVVSLRERRGTIPIERLLECRMAGVEVEEREAMYERLTGKLAIESMRPSYLIYGRGFAKDPLTMALKRVCDIAASLAGLVLSLPLTLPAALLIKLTSKGPVFFTQERVGQDGQVFRIIKFRTMRQDAEKDSGPVWASESDDRVTPIGRILRVTRIDEIPQFANILAGRMSFIGPRPERPHFVEQLQRQIPFYPLRHTVKPGLTGWAQVRHPYAATTEDAMEKLRYDLYYIKNMGLLFDLDITLRTIGVILFGKGAR
ncbi:MAG: hypothetical protein Fur0037_27170 [Planctomycetota bacterium]